jgi:hypothetical protein
MTVMMTFPARVDRPRSPEEFGPTNGAATLTLPVMSAVDSCLHEAWTGAPDVQGRRADDAING